MGGDESVRMAPGTGDTFAVSNVVMCSDACDLTLLGCVLASVEMADSSSFSFDAA